MFQQCIDSGFLSQDSCLSRTQANLGRMPTVKSDEKQCSNNASTAAPCLNTRVYREPTQIPGRGATVKSNEEQCSDNASTAPPCLVNQLSNRKFRRKQCGEPSRKYLSRHSHIMRRRCKGGSVGARVRRPERFSARVGGIAFAVCFLLVLAFWHGLGHGGAYWNWRLSFSSFSSSSSGSPGASVGEW